MRTNHSRYSRDWDCSLEALSGLEAAPFVETFKNHRTELVLYLIVRYTIKCRNGDILLFSHTLLSQYFPVLIPLNICAPFASIPQEKHRRKLWKSGKGIIGRKKKLQWTPSIHQHKFTPPKEQIITMNQLKVIISNHSGLKQERQVWIIKLQNFNLGRSRWDQS